MGMGIGEDARGRLKAAWGEALGEPEEAGVSAKDARSGSSRDFFLVRRDLCTRWEPFAEGTGLPPREEMEAGDCVRREELWGRLELAAFEVELPMLWGRRAGCGLARSFLARQRRLFGHSGRSQARWQL